MIDRLLNIEKELGKKKSAFLFGARGVGKTFLVEETWKKAHKENFIHINLLEFEVYDKYLKAPHLFRLEILELLKKKNQIKIFLDEVQKIPALLDEIHALMNNNKENLQFLLSGSSARKLKRSGANMLAGRANLLKLHPLSSQEIEQPIEKYLAIGSLPGVVLDNDDPEASLRSYVATYLKEEIQMEALVRRIDAFSRFLEIAGQHHGKIFNSIQIAKVAGVTDKTISEYIQILEDTLIAWRLPGWHASVKKQLRTAPKIYLFDNGVANALRGELTLQIKEQTSRFGELFECFIVQELFRLNDYFTLDLKLSYWRTNSNVEVDIILSRGMGQPMAAIEIKSAKIVEESDLHGLFSFTKEYPNAPCYVFCRAEKAYSLGKINILPWQDGLNLFSKGNF